MVRLYVADDLPTRSIPLLLQQPRRDAHARSCDDAGRNSEVLAGTNRGPGRLPQAESEGVAPAGRDGEGKTG